MLSKDAVSDIFNTTRWRIHWLSWMNLGIAGLGGVLAYRPELRGIQVTTVAILRPSVELIRRQLG
jgi:hypothetical protein